MASGCFTGSATVTGSGIFILTSFSVADCAILENHYAGNWTVEFMYPFDVATFPGYSDISM